MSSKTSLLCMNVSSLTVTLHSDRIMVDIGTLIFYSSVPQLLHKLKVQMKLVEKTVILSFSVFGFGQLSKLYASVYNNFQKLYK